MKKLVRRIVIGVVLLIVAAVVAVLLLINPLAKTGVERGAGYALGVDTRVDRMDVKLFGGELAMEGLQTDNPAGFESPYFFRSGTFDMKLQKGTVFADPIVLERFVLDGLDVHVEQKLTSSNVAEILRNLRRFEKEAPEGGEKKKPGKRVKIDRVEIRNVAAHFHLLGGEPITVNVPAIELTNVSSDDVRGVAVSELVARLVPAILAAVLDEGRGTLPPGLTSDLSGQLQATAATLGEQGRSLIGEAGGELGGRLLEAAGSLEGEGETTTQPLGALEGLFSRPKEDHSQ
jgi:hypothetical protein